MQIAYTVHTNKNRGAQPHEGRTSLNHFSQLREHLGNLPSQLFIVSLELGDLLRMHAEGVDMDGHLIKIVGTPPL